MRDSRKASAGASKLALCADGGTVALMRLFARLLPPAAVCAFVAALVSATASAPLFTTGCALPSATADAGTDPTTTEGGTTTPQATGAGCAQDPDTGVTLCQAISLCPTVVVDTDLYPGCGFRIHGTVLDLECVCNDGSLCPVGIPVTCTQAQQILNVQNATIVCAQVNEGRCTNAGTGTGSGTDASTSTCDKDCQSQCGGDPGCYRSCGC